MEIRNTTNYNKFNLLKFNRPIIPTKVEQMIKAYRDGMNLFSAFPIVVDQNMAIFDGQHRFEACKELNIPVYYVVIKTESTIEQISTINANQTKWDLSNFCHAFIQQGNKNYQLVRDFHEKANGLSVSVCCEILKQKQPHMTKEFNTGAFKVADYKKAEDILYWINEFRKIDNTKYKQRNFIRVLICFQKIPGFSFRHLLDKVKMLDGRIKAMANVKEEMWQLNEIYNWKTREENKVNLFRIDILNSK